MQSGGVCRAVLATLQKRRTVRFIKNIRLQHAASIQPIESRKPPEKSSPNSTTTDHQAHKSRIIQSDFPPKENYQRVLEKKLGDWCGQSGHDEAYFAHWKQILLNPSPDVLLHVYLQSEDELPWFLLLHILKYEELQKHHVRALLVHTWYRLTGYEQRDITVDMTENGTDTLFSPDWHIRPWKLSTRALPTFRLLPRSLFAVLIARFLMQARRILPQALPSIAYLINAYKWSTEGNLEPFSNGSTKLVHNKAHTWLSEFYSQMIENFSLPPKQNPAKDMKFAWDGVRIMIEQAGQYTPPLLLNQDSYRAVVRILTAAGKSSKEKKFASNLSSNWPPWREAMDGFDEERSIEDDLTRSVLASRRMTEGGYRLDPLDQEMQITGGRDLDGTPTIATRYISKRNKNKTYASARIWVGRIRATRTAREAWTAFMEYDKQKKGKITADVYKAVFEKLVSERLRIVRSQVSNALPGESQDVLQHDCSNFSSDELARTEPLEESMLYNRMRHSGFVPSGRFLNFLVRNAPDVFVGVKYLQDADLHRDALTVILDCPSFQDLDAKILDKIPYQTIDAFIKLLCRFTHTQSYSSKHRSSWESHDASPEHHTEIDAHGIARSKTPLHYAIGLVRFYKPAFVTTWHSIFKALASPYTLVAAPFSGHPQDDVLSWHVLKKLVEEFRSTRLDLDIDGFHSMCLCFEKAIRSSWVPEDGFSWGMIEHISADWKQQGFVAIKSEWSYMARSTNLPFSVPRLLFSFHFTAIHAYTRILGHARDWAEMVNLLEWMIFHKEEMDQAAEDDVNGEDLRRRVLIAMKCFLEEAITEAENEEYFQGDGELTEDESSQEQTKEEITEEKEQLKDPFRAAERIRSLLDQEELWEWGGWPDDEDTREYRSRDGRFRLEEKV